MAAPNPTCTHLDQIKSVAPDGDTCKDCLREGTQPVNLRQCLTCGHIGCCDSSIGRHATKHFEATGHPIIESFKQAAPGESEWRYCYIDKDYI